MRLVEFLYRFVFIPFAGIYLRVFSFFNKKAAKREQSWKKLLQKVEMLPKSKRVLFHASSMGEFEQAKPVIERLKAIDPEIHIIVSFFSPSGYDNQKDYPFANEVIYMPFDTRRNARRFLSAVNPDIAVFIRYEIWLNHLKIMKEMNIAAILICATIPGRKSAPRNRLIRDYYRLGYSQFNEIYTIGEKHTEYFQELGIDSLIITSSDTRFDRIAENVEAAANNPIIDKKYLPDNQFVLVAGSTWPPDEDILVEAIEGLPVTLVFVPHEPTEENIKRLIGKIKRPALLSEIERSDHPDKRFEHIIVDSIGILLRLYGIADLAYVGGAFGAGVHSVTEPAGYGLPLAAGPMISNSPDAIELHKDGALSQMNNSNDLHKWLNQMIYSENERNSAGKIARSYVQNSTGAAEIVANKILGMIS